MAGEQPAFRLKARLKKGQGNRPVDIGAAWTSQVGFNFRLAKGVELFVEGVKVTDGPQGDFWLNLYDNRPSPEEQDPLTGAVTPRSSFGLSGGGSAKHTEPPEKDDDIPF
jgi:hypothetical protein